MSNSIRQLLLGASLLLMYTVEAIADESARVAIERLQGDGVQVSTDRVSGYARFVRVAPGDLTKGRVTSGKTTDEARAFLDDYGAVFGVRRPETELSLVRVKRNAQGIEHVVFDQRYEGLPVFGGQIRVHFDRKGHLVAANGVFVAGLAIDTTPRLKTHAAHEHARQAVAAHVARESDRQHHDPLTRNMDEALFARDRAGARDEPLVLEVYETELLIFRAGLARGTDGATHLAYAVGVRDKSNFVDQLVFVDAHDGAVLDRIDNLHKGLDRTVSQTTLDNVVWRDSTNDPDPISPGWAGGTAQRVEDWQHEIDGARESYHFFKHLSGGTHLSYDGNDTLMRSLHHNENYFFCPNAFWWTSELHTSFCEGVTSDDIVTHEWGHGVTQFTNDLIYQWQPGALSESYSDIWGETVDMINGRGRRDTPNPPRTEGACSIRGVGRPMLEITAPAELAGDYKAGGSIFNSNTGFDLSGQLVLVDDGVGNGADACEEIPADLTGAIALVEFASCHLLWQIEHVNQAGAVAVVFINNTDFVGRFSAGSFLPIPVPPWPAIPALMIGKTDGELLRAATAASARVSWGASGDPGYRWLIGEDAFRFRPAAFPDDTGVIRDMWSPTCHYHPGKVSDSEYWCFEGDNGGVHFNSGVPNHAFALMVDGGNYGGHSITPIGLTKAAHIHWLAQNMLTPTSQFADHADALESACAMLIGVDVAGLSTAEAAPGPSGEIVSAADCAEVARVNLAVEFRDPPTQCNFRNVLDPDAPALCTPPAQTWTNTFENFELDALPVGWSTGNRDVANPDVFATPDWRSAGNLPDDRAGRAAFVRNVRAGSCGFDSENYQTGAVFMDTPSIVLPHGAPRLAFDHWVRLDDWDGGNIKISVNGGAWTLVPPEAIAFNTYNTEVAPTYGSGFPNPNPLAGEPVWSGYNTGSIDLDNWGQSQIDLSGLASAGDVVRVRAELGVDICWGDVGWYVDDFHVYSCVECQAFHGEIDGGGKIRGHRGEANFGLEVEFEDGIVEGEFAYRNRETGFKVNGEITGMRSCEGGNVELTGRCSDDTGPCDVVIRVESHGKPKGRDQYSIEVSNGRVESNHGTVYRGRIKIESDEGDNDD